MLLGCYLSGVIFGDFLKISTNFVLFCFVLFSTTIKMQTKKDLKLKPETTPTKRRSKSQNSLYIYLIFTVIFF